MDAVEEIQDVVVEFIKQAEDLASKAGKDVKERKKVLEIYEGRRKNEAEDGSRSGLDNWECIVRVVVRQCG